MSEEADEMEDRNLDGTEPSDEQNEARALCVKATQTWIDSFEGFEGSVVVGYVLIMETQRVGEPPVVTWMSGNGVEPEDGHPEGLATHRVSGLVRHVAATLDARAISDQLNRLQDDS